MFELSSQGGVVATSSMETVFGWALLISIVFAFVVLLIHDIIGVGNPSHKFLRELKKKELEQEQERSLLKGEQDEEQ